MCRFRSSCTCAKYHQGLCSPFVHSVVSKESASRQGRPWSNCADEQADLGLRCLHMPKDTFSHGAVQPIYQIIQSQHHHKKCQKCWCCWISFQSNKIAFLIFRKMSSFSHKLQIRRIHIIFFLFLHENIYCGYSLEAPYWGASNEYPQHMFSWRSALSGAMFLPALLP